jgi:acyl-coenzyme A synthetase/AMP-(fatty) acid ligase
MTCPNGSGGMLVVKRPWPSMIRTIWNDPERFKKSYFPPEMGGTYYLAGDGAVRSADRLLPHHGPHRRRAQRVGPPPGHDGD